MAIALDMRQLNITITHRQFDMLEQLVEHYEREYDMHGLSKSQIVRHIICDAHQRAGLAS